jgi:hypothetical protein
MSSRVISLLLALVLFWCGVSTAETPRLFAPPSPEQSSANAHASGQVTTHEGSVEDHHLDDQPTHAQSDTPPEVPDLLPVSMTTRLRLDGPAQPRVPASVALMPPFHAGPLRPPCQTPIAG